MICSQEKKELLTRAARAERGEKACHRVLKSLQLLWDNTMYSAMYSWVGYFKSPRLGCVDFILLVQQAMRLQPCFQYFWGTQRGDQTGVRQPASGNAFLVSRFDRGSAVVDLSPFSFQGNGVTASNKTIEPEEEEEEEEDEDEVGNSFSNNTTSLAITWRITKHHDAMDAWLSGSVKGWEATRRSATLRCILNGERDLAKQSTRWMILFSAEAYNSCDREEHEYLCGSLPQAFFCEQLGINALDLSYPESWCLDCWNWGW